MRNTPQQLVASSSLLPIRRARSFSVLLAVGCAASLTACGGSGGGSSSASSGGSTPAKSAKPVTLNVGVIPIADDAPLFVGIQQGFFKQENLIIHPQVAQGGAAIVPAVISGSNQIGFSNTTSLVIARSKGLPIKIIAEGDNGSPIAAGAEDAVLVAKESPIKTAKDLEGKTIAVNTLNNVGPLTINASLEKRGVDYKTVKYTEINFPDMPAALAAHRVDAVWEVEPFVTAIKGTGGRTIVNPFEETARNYTVAAYFTTEAYIKQNPSVVQRFATAMSRALAFSQQHPDVVRKAVLTYTKIPPQAAAVMKLPVWPPKLNQSTIQLTAQLAKKYGYIDTVPTLGDLIYGP